MLRPFFRAFLYSLAILLVMEFALRINAGFALPYVPTESDETGVTNLMPSTSFRVRFAGRAPVIYHTDEQGARTASRHSEHPISVIALGDSQILGYGIPFEDTAAAKVAAAIEPAGKAKLIAAPGVDIETMAVRACGLKAARSIPALQIIGLNLGNDLDEMYIAGQSRRSTATSPVLGWLGLHSYLYAYWLVNKYSTSLEQHPLPGINPILFRLTSPERAILAREAAARVIEVATCSCASRTIVLLFPSDFQLDPSELIKYKAFSPETAEFDKWYSRRTELAQSMNSLENYIVSNLTSKGLEVISFRKEALDRRALANELFDRNSHHLTSFGQHIAADAILARMR